jgi:ABC-type dipeptide/oligopeptide/nickel transport system permease subunit
MKEDAKRALLAGLVLGAHWTTLCAMSGVLIFHMEDRPWIFVGFAIYLAVAVLCTAMLGEGLKRYTKRK